MEKLSFKKIPKKLYFAVKVESVKFVLTLNNPIIIDIVTIDTI